MAISAYCDKFDLPHYCIEAVPDASDPSEASATSATANFTKDRCKGCPISQATRQKLNILGSNNTNNHDDRGTQRYLDLT